MVALASLYNILLATSTCPLIAVGNLIGGMSSGSAGGIVAQEAVCWVVTSGGILFAMQVSDHQYCAIPNICTHVVNSIEVKELSLLQNC